MMRPTQSADLNADVTDVLAVISEALGEDDAPRLSVTLDEDVDEDERPTGTYRCYEPRDAEADGDGSIPEVLAGALVYADGQATPPRLPIARTLRPRYLWWASAATSALLVVLMAIAAWLM